MKAGRGRAEQAVRLRAVLEPFFVHAQLALPFFTLRPCPFPHLRRPFLLLRCCPFFSSCAVLQVFVANPNKAKPILDILIKNREKLVTFLSAFHNDRQGLLPRCCRPCAHARVGSRPLLTRFARRLPFADDEQFNEEKTFLLKQIQDL